MLRRTLTTHFCTAKSQMHFHSTRIVQKFSCILSTATMAIHVTSKLHNLSASHLCSRLPVLIRCVRVCCTFHSLILLSDQTIYLMKQRWARPRSIEASSSRTHDHFLSISATESSSYVIFHAFLSFAHFSALKFQLLPCVCVHAL